MHVCGRPVAEVPGAGSPTTWFHHGGWHITMGRRGVVLAGAPATAPVARLTSARPVGLWPAPDDPGGEQRVDLRGITADERLLRVEAVVERPGTQTRGRRNGRVLECVGEVREPHDGAGQGEAEVRVTRWST